MEFLIHDVFDVFIPKKQTKSYNLESFTGTYLKTLQVQSTQELIHECHLLGYYSILYQNEELFMDSKLPPCNSNLVVLKTKRKYYLYRYGGSLKAIIEVGSIRQLFNKYPNQLITLDGKELELSDPLPPNHSCFIIIPCCI